MVEFMKRKNSERFGDCDRSEPDVPGSNPPPLLSKHEDCPPSVGLTSAPISSNNKKIKNIVKGAGVQSTKGEQLVEISERGTGLGGIRRFLVQPKCKFPKDTQTEYNYASPTEEGRSESGE